MHVILFCFCEHFMFSVMSMSGSMFGRIHVRVHVHVCIHVLVHIDFHVHFHLLSVTRKLILLLEYQGIVQNNTPISFLTALNTVISSNVQ